MSGVVARLADLGLELPSVAPPLAAYVPAVRSGAHVYTAGQLPFVDGRLPHTGKVGAEVSEAEAVECAKYCALNALAALRTEVEDLDAVARIVELIVFVASAPDFTAQPAVANGASELIGSVFGSAGRHARSAVGVGVLPLDAPVELKLIAQVG